MEAEADPERLRRPTEAMLQAQAHDRVAREIRSQLPVLGPEKGFTDTAIVSDVRFKIMAALRSAGLEVRREYYEGKLKWSILVSPSLKTFPMSVCS